MRARLAAATALTALIAAVAAPAPAQATSCLRERTGQTHVIGGATVMVDVWVTNCLGITRIDGASITGSKPVRVQAVEVWRYRYVASKGAVRSKAVPAPRGAHHGVPLPGATARLATHRPGWAGFVRLKLVAGGAKRTVNVHV